MKKSGLAAGFALAAAFVLGGSAAATAPRIGGIMPEGIYAGVPAKTGKAMYTTPGDAPGLYTWEKGAEYCAALETDGHQDWRAPTKGELNELFRNRAAIGGFNETGSLPAGWYWSSSRGTNYAWGQRFSDGSQSFDGKDGDSSLRCVR